jgi:HAMP domain-containing protein
VDRTELDAAAQLSRLLLGLLGFVTVGAVLAVSFAVARAMAMPMQRLKAALIDAAAGNFDFRISHRRRDEFGDLFDAFNQLAVAVEVRLESAAASSQPGHGEPTTGPFAANRVAAHVAAALDCVARLEDAADSTLVLKLGRGRAPTQSDARNDETRIMPPVGPRASSTEASSPGSPIVETSTTPMVRPFVGAVGG